MRLFAVLTLLLSLPLFAQQYRPEVLPVKLEMTDRGHWQLSYHLPCDSIELGIFVSPPSDGSTKIGMAVQRYHQRCASIGSIKSMPIPEGLSQSLIASPFELVSFNPSIEAQTYRLIHPLEVKNPSTSPGLQILYETRCGPFMGVVYSPRAHATELAIVESEDARRQNCLANSLQLNDLSELSLPGDYVAMPMESVMDQGTIRPSYRLRMQAIQPGSLTPVAGRNGIVALNYLRQCNQAPVGLITQKRDGKTLLAMLVAEYPQDICSKSSTQQMWSRFETRILQPKHLDRIRPARVPHTVELELVYASHVEVSPDHLVVKGYGDRCQLRPSTVYVERNDEILLGILNAKLPGRSCQNQIAELSLRQERNPMLVWADELGPLRLTN